MTYSPPVSNTPTNNTPCVAFGSNGQWKNFGGIQPWYRQPGGTKCGREHKSERGSSGTVLSREL